MKTENLKILENKLKSVLLDDQDIQRYADLTEEYTDYLEEIVENYSLKEMPHIYEKIWDILKAAQIKEFLLQKEAVELINKVLNRAAN